ncbi:MAG: hypothetical protein JST80_07640 [Bdellovibrionales bacterium]|nr:hypothetical protein [Bdellovibrionales bacterium]
MNGLILPFVNFVALVGFLFYKGKGPFVEFVRGRHQDIKAGLNKSKIQVAEAAAKKAEIEAKLKGLDGEKQAIIAEWKEREVQQIKAIQETSIRVVAQLKVDADLNKKVLEQSFRSDAARAIAQLVIAKAEQKLKSSMTAESHKKINDGFVKELMGA